MTDTEALEAIAARHPETRPGYTCQTCYEPTPCSERRLIARVGSGAVPPQDIRDAVWAIVEDFSLNVEGIVRGLAPGPIRIAPTVDAILAVVRPVEKPDGEEFELAMTTGGHRVTVTVAYPKGHAMLGLYALHGVNQPEKMVNLMAILADDPSVAARLAEMGVAVEADEDDE